LSCEFSAEAAVTNRRERRLSSDSPGFAAGNQRAPSAILESPDRYGGETAALVRWARQISKQLAEQE
jgi:hypothetical protein